MNESQKEKQKELLSEGRGWDCYMFARDVPGADIQALQARVLEIGTGCDCYRFAINIHSADVDVDALIDKAERLQRSAWELHD